MNEHDSSISYVLYLLYFRRWAEYFTCVRDISGSHYSPDLLHALKIWRKSAMTAENLLINDSCYWQAIEAVRECLPQLDIVSAFALVVETWWMHRACRVAIVNHLSNKDFNLWQVSLDKVVTSEVKYNFNHKFKWTLLSIYLHSKVLQTNNYNKVIYLQIMVLS